MSLDAPFFTQLSCQFTSRLQNAFIMPIVNALPLPWRLATFVFAAVIYAAVYAILYYVVPICTFNSSDGLVKNSSRTAGFAAMFYYIISFFIVLATYNGGCISAFEKLALYKDVGPTLADYYDEMNGT